MTMKMIKTSINRDACELAKIKGNKCWESVFFSLINGEC